MNLYLLLALVVAAAIAGALMVRAIGGNFTLIEDWKKAFTFYSTYALGLVAFLPDIFNGLLSGGYLEGTPVGDQFSLWVKIGAALTFFLRMIKQVPKPQLPKFDPTDQAGT